MSESFPVLLVTGPRQTGKTTTLRYLAETDTAPVRRNYVTLDDPKIRELAQSDPAAFIEKYPAPLLLDEVQYAPELFPYIKMKVDENRVNGSYWLTGSQTFLMMKNVSESLAGRIGILTFQGLSMSEINGSVSEPFTTDINRLSARESVAPRKTLVEIYDMIFRGSMPEMYANPKLDHHQFYSAYVKTYLERDVNDLSQIGDRNAFLRFITAAAARTGRMLVYDDLAKDADISVPTAKRWMSILLASHIAVLVQPYHNNLLKRIVKTPVMHFLDTGLCAYLLGWETPDVLERGAMAGNFLETFVFAEIYKSYVNAGYEPPLFYYRDSDKREIDLLIYRNCILSPVEVKKTSSPDKKAVSHIRYLREKMKDDSLVTVGTGSVICMTNTVLPLTPDDLAVPVWLI